MTSCTGRGGAGLGHGWRIALWLGPAALILGCGPAEEVVEIEMASVPGAGVHLPCHGLEPARPDRAGLLVVELFRLSPDAPPGEVCLDCLEGRPWCEPIAAACRCGLPIEVAPAELDAALSGLRFEDLEPSGRYCVRLGILWMNDPPEQPFSDCLCPPVGPQLPLDLVVGCSTSRTFQPIDPGFLEDRPPPLELTLLCAADGDPLSPGDPFHRCAGYPYPR